MTNFEYYKEEILELTNNDQAFMVYKNGKIGNCDECHDCKKCLFDSNSCNAKAIKWLYAEHVEKPKLTKKERQFCELVEAGWICRDENGFLCLYSTKPQCKNSHEWQPPHYCTSFSLSSSLVRNVMDCSFSFITWEDEEPWSVEELLKLEVEE